MVNSIHVFIILHWFPWIVKLISSPMASTCLLWCFSSTKWKQSHQQHCSYCWDHRASVYVVFSSSKRRQSPKQRWSCCWDHRASVTTSSPPSPHTPVLYDNVNKLKIYSGNQPNNKRLMHQHLLLSCRYLVIKEQPCLKLIYVLNLRFCVLCFCSFYVSFLYIVQ